MAFFKKILLVVVLAVIALFYIFPLKPNDTKLSLGVTFSKPFAEFMGLDWREAYLAILDDLGTKNIRLMSYWNESEPSDGDYSFADLDWQIAEASKRGVKIILVLGQKQPRWPECHIPVWAKNLPLEERQAKLMNLIKTVVSRYKSEKNITAWQVENEHFFHFGECPEYDTDFFDKEIAYVRFLDDSRPIIISDSGEMSSWYRAAARADILGTTLYRIVYNKNFGYFKYPIPVSYYMIKAWLVKKITPVKQVIIAELQGEAWGPQIPNEMTMEEQNKSMNPEKLRDIVQYARYTGFSEAYLWGAEWWYWQKKAKGDDRMWSEAKRLFRE